MHRQARSPLPALPLTLLLAAACSGAAGESASESDTALSTTDAATESDTDTDTDSETETDTDTDGPIAGYPDVAGPCGEAPPASPRFLAVTTTDFATGALTIVDLAAKTSTPDVALGSTDAKPYAHGGLIYLVHRYLVDALDVLDPADWSLASQRSLAVEGVTSANPQDLVFAADERGYLPLLGAPEVLVFDFTDPKAPTAEASIDLRPVADEDGNPEASLAVVCGDTLFVSLERLDPENGLAPRFDHDLVAVIDRSSGRIHDLDLAVDGIQSIALQGLWARQWRRDPADPGGQTMLVLTTGLERLDLRSGASEWVISDARFAEQGITSHFQPQSFAVSGDGAVAFIAAYADDFTVFIDRYDLKDPNAAVIRVLEGLDSAEEALELVGDTLWVGDRTFGAAGVRGFDVAGGAISPLFPDPLDTGLAPYAMTLVP